MTTNTAQPPAGWYPDPQGTGAERWWNGSAWSAETRTAPPVTPPPPPAAPAGYPGAPAAAGHPDAAQGSGHPGAAPGAPNPYAQPAYGAQNPYQPAGYPYTAPPIGTWRSPADDRPLVTGMGGAIRTVFSKYANFEGRASRPEFWYWALFYGIILAGCYALLIVGAFAAVGLSYRSGYGMSAFSGLFVVLIWLWLLAAFLPTLAATVRRLRDAGYHWAFIFLSFVPFGGIAVLVMCCMPSKYP